MVNPFGADVGIGVRLCDGVAVGVGVCVYK